MKHKYYPTIKLNKEDIELLSKIFSIDHNQVLENLKNQSFIEAQKIYKQLNELYTKWLKMNNDSLEKTKAKLFILHCKDIISYRKVIEGKINDDKKRKESVNLDIEKLVLTKKASKLFNKILRREDISGFNCKDFVVAFSIYLQEKKITNDLTIYLNDFISELIRNNNFDSVEYINLLKGTIAKRLKKISKKEKFILKDMDEKLSYALVSFEEDNYIYDYMLDIISFWLSSEKNEYYMLALIDNYPDIFKLVEKREANDNVDEVSIIRIVFEKYMESCKDELINQKKNIVNKDYYLKIFNKLYNSPNYLHDSDKDIIAMREELLKFIKEGNYKQERKTEILNSIKNLTMKEQEIPALHEIDKEDLNDNIKYVYDYLKEALYDPSRINLTNEEVLLLGNHEDDLFKYGYSVSYTKDGNTILRLHIVDSSVVTYEDTPIDKDAKNNNFLDERIQKVLKLRINKTSPTITYQLNIDKKGRIYNYKVFKSLIKPVDFISKNTPVFELKKDLRKKPLLAINNAICNYYELDNTNCTFEDINKRFLESINNLIGGYLTSHDIPCIYKVQKAPDGEEYAHQLTNLNYYMYRLKEDDFRKVYSIICNKNNNKAHYSINASLHYGTDRKYVLSLTKPFTYVGICFQRLMQDLYMKNISLKELQNPSEYLEIINYYNKKFYNIDSKEEYKKKGNVRKNGNRDK